MTNEWIQIEDAESTIAHFIDGWMHPKGMELLIWKGVNEEGEIHIEPHLHDSTPEGTEYILEEKYDGNLVDEYFASTEGEIRNIASDQRKMFEDIIDRVEEEFIGEDGEPNVEGVREKPAGLSLDGLEPLDIIGPLLNDVKRARAAAGEVKGVHIVLKLYKIREDDGDRWKLKAEVAKEVGDGVTGGGEIGLQQSNIYSQAGDAILDFNALVERYNLEELTDPDKEIDYLKKEDIE